MLPVCETVKIDNNTIAITKAINKIIAYKKTKKGLKLNNKLVIHFQSFFSL